VPHLIAALIFYYVDAFWMGQFAIVSLAAIVAVIIGLVQVVRGSSGYRMRLWHGLMVLLIWPSAVYGALTTVFRDLDRARGRAAQVTGALHAYREAHGSYPPSLQALVPEFLPTIPPAKDTGFLRNFRYAWDGKRG
jgi:hypothetical protein